MTGELDKKKDNVPCLITIHPRIESHSSHFLYPSLLGNDSSVLTPSQEHYLKKYLLSVLINNELDRLQATPYETLPNLGGPFDPKDEHAQSTTPFLRYLFESIVVPFPFLTGSKGELWPKLQSFMEEWAKIESGNGIEKDEMLRRRRLRAKGERTMVMMYSMAIKTVEQRAQEKKDLAAHGSSALEESLNQLQLQKEPTKEQSNVSGPSTDIYGALINVAGIKSVWVRRHVREHEHAVRAKKIVVIKLCWGRGRRG